MRAADISDVEVFVTSWPDTSFETKNQEDVEPIHRVKINSLKSKGTIFPAAVAPHTFPQLDHPALSQIATDPADQEEEGNLVDKVTLAKEII